uniref:Uncharacterized protein n=1 Tax=Sphenodon punctatus TaxID=8508 RepID=A0A8D0GFM4_SPHPU
MYSHLLAVQAVIKLKLIDFPEHNFISFISCQQEGFYLNDWIDPIALGVLLAANLTAGHLLLLLIALAYVFVLLLSLYLQENI